MGTVYRVKCSDCDFGIELYEGVGMMFSQNNVLYGHNFELELACCFGDEDEDKTHVKEIFYVNASYEYGKPLILELVKDKSIRERAFSLITQGAQLGDGTSFNSGYGRKLYLCPKCKHIEGMFFFRLELPSEIYEPDYCCTVCVTSMKRLELRDNWLRGAIREVRYRNFKKTGWKCRDCSGNKLIYFVSGHWD